MSQLEKYALVGTLIEALSRKGSRCGETHIQKAAYVAKHLLGVPLDEEFILYKHGPFSFGLRDTLSAMRADSVLNLVVRDKYGASYQVTKFFGLIGELYGENARKYSAKFELVASLFGTKGVAELERFSTALYVRLEGDGNETPEVLADRLVQLKPHILRAHAQEAIRQVGAAWLTSRELTAT